jgi:hypothetical protein
MQRTDQFDLHDIPRWAGPRDAARLELSDMRK